MREREIVVCEDSERGRWGLARGRPNPRLCRYVSAYHGAAFDLDEPQPVQWRYLPSTAILLVIGFGGRVRRLAGNRPDPPGEDRAVLCGMDTEATVLEHSGKHEGVGVKLTPLGAYRLGGIPMWELTDRAADLTDLAGSAGRALVGRLAAARGWPDRFAVLDQFLLTRFAAGPTPDPQVQWAWDQLLRSAGTATVGELAHRVGWSRQHLFTRFRDQVGLPPKSVARVVRLQRALHLLTWAERRTLAEVAATCGYYDQAHLNRDFRDIAGCAPRDLVPDLRSLATRVQAQDARFPQEDPAVLGTLHTTLHRPTPAPGTVASRSVV